MQAEDHKISGIVFKGPIVDISMRRGLHQQQ